MSNDKNSALRIRQVISVLALTLGAVGGILFFPQFSGKPENYQPYRPNPIFELLHLLGMSYQQMEGAFLGLGIAFLLLLFLFLTNQELREEMFKNYDRFWNGGNNIYTHPTNLPLTIAAIWCAVFAIVIVTITKISTIELGTYTIATLIIPMAFLLGLSGFQMIKRNETLNRFVNIYKGFWAYLNGTILILMGWGGLMYLLLAWIFNWK